MSGPAIVELRLDGEPVPKGRPRVGRNGNVYTPDATAAAELAIGWRVRERYTGLAPTALPVGLAVAFRSRGSRGKRRGRADLDNLVKLVKDALNGIAWVDDSQVEELHATLARDSPDPGTDIRVYLLEGTQE